MATWDDGQVCHWRVASGERVLACHHLQAAGGLNFQAACASNGCHTVVAPRTGGTPVAPCESNGASPSNVVSRRVSHPAQALRRSLRRTVRLGLMQPFQGCGLGLRPFPRVDRCAINPRLVDGTPLAFLEEPAFSFVCPAGCDHSSSFAFLGAS